LELSDGEPEGTSEGTLEGCNETEGTLLGAEDTDGAKVVNPKVRAEFSFAYLAPRVATNEKKTIKVKIPARIIIFRLRKQ